MCAGDDLSRFPALGSACTPHETARPAAPGHVWHHAVGCRSGKDPSVLDRPGS